MLNPLFRGGRIASCVLFAPRSVRAGRSMIATVYEVENRTLRRAISSMDSCFRDIRYQANDAACGSLYLTRNPTRNSDWFVSLRAAVSALVQESRPLPRTEVGELFLMRLPDLLMFLRQATSRTKPPAVIRQTRLSRSLLPRIMRLPSRNETV